MSFCQKLDQETQKISSPFLTNQYFYLYDQDTILPSWTDHDASTTPASGAIRSTSTKLPKFATIDSKMLPFYELRPGILPFFRNLVQNIDALEAVGCSTGKRCAGAVVMKQMEVNPGVFDMNGDRRNHIRPYLVELTSKPDEATLPVAERFPNRDYYCLRVRMQTNYDEDENSFRVLSLLPGSPKYEEVYGTDTGCKTWTFFGLQASSDGPIQLCSWFLLTRSDGK
ncbi:hypothetical protein EDD18DRAFT_1111681 [Armillaria luteobubalina]|uniref:Uncharacterized protein n=1 Tax=Armillaria luteobubalina TaxID=153913 RepID=A0AA39PHB9_9AGAR|nr:hypothetical protein EDD18DRAFT_1111681 [Armillaria luteobubalina]